VNDAAAVIAENLQRVRDQIDDALRRSGRVGESVKLVAVTKYVSADVARALVTAGCHDLGESRPQELWKKVEDLSDIQLRWHMIGHMQRNKVRRSLPLIALLHSGDSLRLLSEVNRVAGDLSRVTPVLLEVNVSGDEAKHGFTLAEVEAALPEIAAMTHLKVRGLMAMAGRAGDLDAAREDFVRLRTLRDRLRSQSPESIQLVELSMGMSGDYSVAVEEGATIVRVGSALFEGIAT
jgi:pyridoxal phosphate enzyme (YggS family)